MLQRDPRSVSESTKSIHLILPRGIVTEQRRGGAQRGSSKNRHLKSRSSLDVVVD